METLSNRGLGAIRPMLAYLDQFLEGARDQHSVENPDGFVLLCVAENRLPQSFEGAMIPKIQSASIGAISAETGAYGDFSGRQQFREAFAGIAAQTFLAEAGLRVDPAQLVVSSGCGAVINNLCQVLCDPGDAVLLPTPTYAALPNDCGVLAKAAVVGMPTEATGYKLTTGVLEAGYAAALAAAHKPRILLLLNPNNPLGTVYSEAELTLAIEFCEVRRMHLVVDEIYANSTHGCASRWLKEASRPTTGADSATGATPDGGPSEPRFVSIVEVMHKRGTAGGSGASATSSVADAAVTGAPAAGAGGSEPQSRGKALIPPEGGSAACTPKVDNAPCGADGTAHAASSAKAHAAPQLASYMGNYVHALWGLSKDWAMSGYRVGVLHSHNAALLKALGNINYFTGVSSDTQDRLAAVLTDTEWCTRYLAANCGALRAAYALVTGILAEARVPFVPACSGMFVWIDLRHYLRHRRTAAPAADAGGGGHREPAASEPDWEAERALTTLMFDKAKVLLTPGEACMAAEPGFYRCCFAWMPQLESVRVGFTRLQKLLQELGPAPDGVVGAP